MYPRIISTRYYSSIPKLPKTNFIPNKYEGRSLKELIEIRKSHLSPLMTTYYKEPLALHQGYMQWLFDINGKRYLDMFGGICTVSVGHCHPKITEAIKKQTNKLNHISNLYLNENIEEYALRLTEKLPGNLKIVYFVNSGSEANELAIFISRLYTGKKDFISLQNGYHGATGQTLDLTSMMNFKHLSFNGQIHYAMCPDIFKGIWGGSKCRDSPIQTSRICKCNQNNCNAKLNYVQQFENLFLYQIRKGNLAGFFAESIQGVGGVVQYPKGYLKDIYDIVHRNGGLFIVDEVQSGFGRTGDHFWGFQGHNIIPDIVTMAKGIGNGFPLGAVVTTPEISATFENLVHFNTFGGNPLACSVGLKVLDIIEEEKLQENSLNIGTYLLTELERFRSKFSIVGDVRGKGLMIGVEFVEDDGTGRPLEVVKFTKIMEKCKEFGLIIGRGGVNGNVLRIKPPMCITKDDANFTIQVLHKVLEEIK